MKTVRTITLPEVRAAARRLDPNATNPHECVYTDDGGRHCVIGQLLVELGAPVPHEEDHVNHDIIDSDDVTAWLLGQGFVIADDALRDLTVAQALADGRAHLTEPSWGNCLREVGLL